MGNLQINGNVNIRDLLTLKSGTDAYTTPSIVFGNDVKIGYGNKNFGIYSSNNIYLRPNSGALGYSDGVELSTTALIPTKNNTVTLGDSTHKWSNVYATTFVGALDGNASSATTADTATQFTSARAISLTGDVTGAASSTGGSGWSIATTIGANNHAHDTSASWSNRTLTISVGGGGAAASATIPATLTGFTSITSATLIASTTMRIPVKASTYTASTAGEIWIVA